MASKIITDIDNPSEDTIQIQVSSYLVYLKLLFIHSPNEGARSERQGYKLKRMGMSKGFPDLFIFEPTSKHHGLAIELKRKKGYKISPEQIKWINDLNDKGYYATVCKGFEEAQKTIDRYLQEII